MLVVTPKQILELCKKTRKIHIVCAIDETIFIQPEKSLLHKKNFLESNEGIEDTDIIIVYCAGWSCNAGKHLAEQIQISLPENCVLEYPGGLAEWLMLQSIFGRDKYPTVGESNGTKDLESRLHTYYETTTRPLAKTLQAFNKRAASLQILKSECSVCTGSHQALRGMNVVVTGATLGLGLETAWMCAASGAVHITITSRNKSFKSSKNVAKAIRTMALLRLGRNVEVDWILADATKKEDNDLVFLPELRKKMNLPAVVHAAVFNAGIFGEAGESRFLESINESQYHTVLRTNQHGVWLGLQSFVVGVQQNSDAFTTIKPAAVLIASMYGSQGSLFSNSAYQMSKAAVKMLAMQAGIELGRISNEEGRDVKVPVRVNSVSPTFLDTNLTRQFANNTEIQQLIGRNTPTGAWGKKESVAKLIIHLLSAAASSVTGCDFPVDCGVLAESIPDYETTMKIKRIAPDAGCCGASS